MLEKLDATKYPRLRLELYSQIVLHYYRCICLLLMVLVKVFIDQYIDYILLLYPTKYKA